MFSNPMIMNYCPYDKTVVYAFILHVIQLFVFKIKINFVLALLKKIYSSSKYIVFNPTPFNIIKQIEIL